MEFSGSRIPIFHLWIPLFRCELRNDNLLQIDRRGNIMAQTYAHPEVLVDTEWADQHKNDQNVRVVEVDVDTKAYEDGHIPGAVGWNWQTQL